MLEGRISSSGSIVPLVAAVARAGMALSCEWSSRL